MKNFKKIIYVVITIVVISFLYLSNNHVKAKDIDIKQNNIILSTDEELQKMQHCFKLLKHNGFNIYERVPFISYPSERTYIEKEFKIKKTIDYLRSKNFYIIHYRDMNKRASISFWQRFVRRECQ